MDAGIMDALAWRLIGPFRGGRVVAVAGDPARDQVFYFGSTGGGVWQTTDGGVYWRNVSDGFFQRASVGALAVAESDPNVVYAGMGETTIRGNVSHGDGVYRSTDAGTTWRHLGLAETRNIAKVRVHPRDPDLVYVAAFGHAHGPNPERGVYRSKDGGQTWELVLHRGEDAGACDLALDRANPRVLYAAFWQARRGPAYLTSGGPGSGLFRSDDGGDTWGDLTRNPGLPAGHLGKIGVAVSPARSGRVWAVVEAVRAEDGGVFRSDDGGESWARLNGDLALRQRAWYYCHIVAAPQDPDTVWALSLQRWKSVDGGRTFAAVPTPHGDNHDLWIDPKNPARMIEGNDGGACVSFNGGASWSTQFNQPTAELYHVTTDEQIPYRVYGAQQDSTTLSVPSRSDAGAITFAECYPVGGGESGHIAVRPDDPNIVYAGSQLGNVTRYDHRTRSARDISIWPEHSWGADAADYRHRFNWSFPLLLSPHDPRVLYAAGNRVFRSTDEGTTWEAIGPDLTRHDPATLRRREPAGEVGGGEIYATVVALAESPLARGLLWAGSDDGLVHVSRDGGRHWEEVTPAGLPAWAYIGGVEPSPHDPAAAYLAATRHKLDDLRPYLYRTGDYGRTWTPIAGGLPDDASVRAIRADPTRRGLLYAGTDTGVFVSFADGASWRRLGGNLPVVPVHDLAVKGTDLVAATHGRSFWILDDLTPLRQLAAGADLASPFLCPRRDTYRFTSSGGHDAPAPGLSYQPAGGVTVAREGRRTSTGDTHVRYLDAGANPPDGVIINYCLPEQSGGATRLSILDATGRLIRSFASTGVDGEPSLPARPGLNRFVWDLRYPGPTALPEPRGQTFPVAGPLAVPGAYRVRLEAAGQTFEESFAILRDPRAGDDAGLAAQFDLLLRIRDRISALHEAVARIRALDRQLAGWARRAQRDAARGDEVVAAATTLREHLAAIEGEFIQLRATTIDDGLTVPAKLNVKLALLAWSVAAGYAAPTPAAEALFADLSARLDGHFTELQRAVETEGAAFDDLIRAVALPPIG